MASPFIVGQDNYYKPFEKYARDLKKEDIGKLMMKVVPVFMKSGDPDYSYVGEVYKIIDISYDNKCFECEKKTNMRCNKCKSIYYCSKECQTKRWKIHKEMCSLYESDYHNYKDRREMLITNVTIEGNVFDANKCKDIFGQCKIIAYSHPYNKQYFQNWIDVKEMYDKGIFPDRKISKEHMTFLRSK